MLVGGGSTFWSGVVESYFDGDEVINVFFLKKKRKIK